MAKIYLEDFHFQARRDTAKNWNTSNPILCDGEFGIVTDSVDENWLKVGDGATPWKLLSFKKGPKGNKGDKGNPFVYSDFTDEQLALLKGAKGDTGDTGPRGLQGEKGDTGATGATGAKGDKGDKGDAFTYNDFTAEQLAELKGAKGDKGDKGDTGEVTEEQMNTAIAAEVSAEKNRANNAFANALKGAVSGSAVRMDDVSHVEHTLGVNVRNKNLFTPNTTPTVPSNMGVTCTYDSTDNTFTINGTLAASGNINLATLNIPLDDYYIARYYVSGDITVPESVAYKSLFSMFVYGSSSLFLERLSQTVADYNTPQLAKEAKNIYSVESADKWTFYMQNFGVGTVFDNYKFKIAIIKKDIYYTGIPFTPYISDFSAVNVTRCGKNLFDKTIPISSYDTDSDVQAGGYCALRFYVGVGTPVTISFTAPTEAFTGMWMFITFSHLAKMEQSAITKYQLLLEGTKVRKTLATNTSMDGYVSFVLTAKVYNFIINNNIQIEIGSTATEYEPYKTSTEYTPAADGTVSGVKSLYPATTLMTDTEGVIIDAEYNRDINKAFAELQQAILSLGGNV